MPEGGAIYKTREAAEKAAKEKAGRVIKVKGGFAVVAANPAPIEEYFKKPPETERNMGGMMQDMPGYMGGGMMDETLGYMHGGMAQKKRGPIKYSEGGAIKGRNFKGSF
jgi:hypothetical protein|tara:strand:+ start:4596 stop:4922 length:327 start_codon:yes stop_codon:yes gene_type:complete